MFGHSPAPVVRTLRAQAARGLTYMLPNEDALAVGALLREVFGPYSWQIAMTASDANRFALRVARAVTGRKKVLVFNGCYHGTVDETMVRLSGGKTEARPGLVGQVVNLGATAVSVEFNDLAAVEEALAKGDVAAVLTEPVLTNCCMVLPEPGFHDALRALSRAYGALLIVDETHTISSGFGGYSRLHGLAPDIFVLGKPIAGGLPAAVWGLSDAVAAAFAQYNASRPEGHSGMGTTLSANPLQFAAMRATLADVMTRESYAKMERNAAHLQQGLAKAIAAVGAPWHVVRVGARVEFICAPGPLRNATEAEAAMAPALEAALHASLLNKGCLIAPFHNMMLVSPATTRVQVNRLIAAFTATLADFFD
jgi:glutamate-1-semialdehyde 2,1-aminomutase